MGGVGGWIGGMLEGYEWIGRRGEEELHHYIIFVSLTENSPLVNEINIVPINLIKLTENKYKYYKCSTGHDFLLVRKTR